MHQLAGEYKKLRDQGYCALLAYVATFRRTPGIPLIYGPDPRRPMCRWSWFRVDENNWRQPSPPCSPEHVPVDIALGDVQQMAHAARLGRIRPLLSLCRRVLDCQPGDIDLTTRLRLIKIWALNIPRAHQDDIRDELRGELAYLVGHMVDHGDAACELGYAVGWLTTKLEAFKDCDPKSEAFENLRMAYQLFIFEAMVDAANERRAVGAAS